MAVDVAAATADELSRFISLEKERLGIPGVSVALIDKGAVQYMNFGVRRSGERDDVSSTDAFDIGSIGKPVTAWAVMRIVELGLVSLDAPVQQYVSRRWQFPDSDFDLEEVTLRRILSHTAGLSAPSYQGFPPGTAPIALEDTLDGLPVRSSAVRITVEPGSEYRHSGGGFALAQLVIESVTGRSFPEFVTSEILEPLGMDQAQYLSFEDDPLAVSPHDFAGRPISDYRMVEHGAGGLRASAQDMVNFLVANMASNPVLAESTVNEMHEPLVFLDGDLRRTLGFAQRGTVSGHGGGNRGWVARIDFQPFSKSGIVILTNSASGRRLINSVRCKWSELFDIDDIKPQCRQQMRTGRITHWTMVVGSGVALLFATWVAWRGYMGLRRGSAQVSLSAATIVRGSIFVCSVVAMWVALGTELGAYLVSGVSWGLPTIGYLPIATPYAAMAMTVLLGVLAWTSLLRRIPA